MSALMKTSDRPNQAELTSYTHYPMRNEHQRKKRGMKISSEFPVLFFEFQKISLQLFPFLFFSLSPFLLMSSLVSPPFCLFQKTTSKEIKARKEE
jgi:hypothetical protein